MLPDGRVVTAGARGRVLVWDPAEPGAGPVELGRHEAGWGRWRCCRTGGWSPAAARRRGGRVLVWDPAEPGTGPVELGRHEDEVRAVAVLPDGRVVTGAGYGGGRVLVWDPAEPGAGPVELGRHEDGVGAVAVLPDGRVVTGGGYVGGGRVLVWDPAEPGTGPVELGRHEDGVGAVAVLPDGRVVTGGHDDRRVLVWDPAEPGSRPGRARPPRRAGWGRWRCCRTGGWSPAATMTGCGCGMCRATHPALCSHAPPPRSLLPSSPSGARLFIGHAAGGISCWEVRPATQNTPGARQRASNAMQQQA